MGEENNEFGFGSLIAELLGDSGPRLPERVVKAYADRTVGNTVAQRWEEKSKWEWLSRTPREEGRQHREVTGKDTEWESSRKDGCGQDGHIGTCLNISETTGNFEKSCVSWGHVKFRCQNAEDGDRKEVSEIMNFDRRKDCSEYPEEEGRFLLLFQVIGRLLSSG